ncbi:MAG: hypothetical protein IJY09_01735 [Lachnospiraceae bacterium]|nr:hypothetical protein [Lachnospiraceae bacterium]
MKKRLFSVLLCLILVCTSFAACGKKDDEKASNDKQEEVKSEEVVVSTMQNFADEVTKALEEAEKQTPDVFEGSGVEMTLEVEPGKELLENYGLAGLEKIGMEIDGDFKEEFMATVDVALNGSSLLEMAMAADNENVYVNLPKYSDSYMAVSIEETLGMSLEEYQEQMMGAMSASMEGMPTVSDIKEIWKDFSTGMIGSITYEDREKDSKVGIEGYEVSGNKYINKVDMEKMGKTLNELMEALAEFDALEITAEEIEIDEELKMYLNYYEGEEGTYAVELTDEEEGFVFVAAEKGYCLYAGDGEENETLFYTVKESDTKGEIVLTLDGEEFVIEYDNYSKNGVDLKMDIEGIEVALSIQEKSGLTTITFDVDGMGMKVSGTLEGTEKETKLTLSGSYQDVEIGTLTMNVKVRDYKEVKIPSDVVDMETWSTGLDVEALMTDLQQIMVDYPFIGNLVNSYIGGEMDEDDYDDYDDSDVIGGDDVVVGGDDITGSDDVETPYEIPAGYSDEFMAFTGYAVDEDGYVDFEPTEEEVLAVGKPSTGFDTIPVTAEQKADLIAYAENAFKEFYLSDYVGYYVWGSIEYESVESYYQEDYTYYDDAEFSNSIELTFDLVSGELGRINVRNVDQAEAIRMTNELLQIVDVDFTVTEENMEEYNEIENVVVSGYEGSSSYSISVAVYED